MKINKIFIISVVLISLFAIGAVSAADAEAIDTVEAADIDEVQNIGDVSQDDIGLLSQNGEDNLKEGVQDEAVNAVAEDDSKVDVKDDLLSDGETKVNDKANITQEINIKVDGKELNSFNYTYVNGSFDFKDLLEKCNLSGEADFNMSKFGNFSDMFNMFNDVNFADLNKTFDFKITGEVGVIKYSLKVLSNDVNFLFDYNIVYPDGSKTTPIPSAKRIEIYGDKKLLANLTIVNGNPDFDFTEMMKMFDMSNLDMSSFDNFKNMFGMFQNINFTGNNSISDNKTFDFKISGLVGKISYDLYAHSNATDFVFDYSIKYPTVDTKLTAKALKTNTVNVALDGKTGGYLTMTLKSIDGKALAGKTLRLVLNGETTRVTTNKDGVAKFQVNFAKAGTYVATICFLGDQTTQASMTTAKVTVNKQKTSLKTNKKSYKFKAKAKKTVKVTLKNAKGKAIKSKLITFKIKNKTFKAKTNKKGVATIKVKFTKKGKYTALAKFTGDNTYKGFNKKVKFVIK